MTIRCAIYTRKSTDEGLQQDFNSLDAQRESAEAYIASQKANGYITLDTRYDDGGYSGGTIDRPAFQRLMTDVDAGRINCIVVYKIDRLSRSLADFARIMETLDARGVTLVAVTQNFSTTSSMGRLTLNILLSFAQFEREMISERTRDKIGAMRRRGKHFGGHPVLGYDVQRDAAGSRLIVNDAEAAQVRATFELYRQHQAMPPVVDELARRGWTTKAWTTKAGRERGGKPIDKSALWRLLTNVVYLGKVEYRGELYDGEQAALIEPDVWHEVQRILRHNAQSGGHTAHSPRRDDFLLRRLLHCRLCGGRMTPTQTTRKLNEHAGKRYRYYFCDRSRRGEPRCTCPTVPAEAVEQHVIDEIAAVARDAETRERALRAAVQQAADDPSLAPLDVDTAGAALEAFDDVWATLSPGEQRRLVRLLVERVDLDAEAGKLAVTFRAAGLAALQQQSDPTDATSTPTPATGAAA